MKYCCLNLTYVLCYCSWDVPECTCPIPAKPANTYVDHAVCSKAGPNQKCAYKCAGNLVSKGDWTCQAAGYVISTSPYILLVTVLVIVQRNT